MRPLTQTENLWAERNHDLVYQFLNKNRLSQSEYYDIVIFGYLCAVREYCENPKLQKYLFSTIAWRKMKAEVKDYKKFLKREKRKSLTVGLPDTVSAKEDYLRFEDVIAADDRVAEELEMKLLLYSIAACVTKREMRIIRKKISGFRMHEIAKSERMTFHDINSLLKKSYDTVVKLLQK